MTRRWSNFNGTQLWTLKNIYLERSENLAIFTAFLEKTNWNFPKITANLTILFSTRISKVVKCLPLNFGLLNEYKYWQKIEYSYQTEVGHFAGCCCGWSVFSVTGHDFRVLGCFAKKRVWRLQSPMWLKNTAPGWSSWTWRPTSQS